MVSLSHYSCTGLGSQIRLSIVWSLSSSALQSLYRDLHGMIYDFEQRYSRFIDTSLISQLNTKKTITMDNDLFHMYLLCDELYTLTNGFFNPLVDLSSVGYSRPRGTAIEAVTRPVNLDRSAVAVYGDTLSLADDMKLDLGGVGKGYVAEKLHHYLLDRGITAHMIDMGGDIYAAGRHPNGHPRGVGVLGSSKQADARLFQLSSYAIATSGIDIRQRSYDQQSYHHIQTPHSDTQTSDICSATVTHPRSAYADGLATALISMGHHRALDFCQKNNIHGYLCSPSGERYDALPHH